MKTTIYRASERGYANHGWLEANHSFSFAGWFNPNKMNFGALRVLNDDRIAAGAGFPKHPHDNMEIVTIPLSGVLEHQDSMGNKAQIKAGEVQVMSAGKGITHSEYNASNDDELRLFQIWMMPNKLNVEPRYDELQLNVAERKNKLQQILSPHEDDDGVWVHQDAWMYMSQLDASNTLEYVLNKPDNGVYIMVVEGDVVINGENLSRRDAVGIEDFEKTSIQATSDTELLFVEVPMQF